MRERIGRNGEKRIRVEDVGRSVESRLITRIVFPGDIVAISELCVV
jgi:hypothetical protein